MSEQETNLILVNLENTIKGFNGVVLSFPVNEKEVKEMVVRDVFQISISSLPPTLEFSEMEHIYNLIPRLSNSKKEISLTVEEKKFLSEAIKKTQAITPIAKSFVLKEMKVF